MGETGRLFRYLDGRWSALDEPLPAVDHAPPTPNMQFAAWVLPRSLQPRLGDVITWGEAAHQLLTRCPPDDDAVENLVTQTLLWHEPDVAAQWLALVEVWLGRRLDGSRPWPEPPAPAQARPQNDK